MKLLTYRMKQNGKEKLGVMCKKRKRDFYPLEQFGLKFRNMNDLLEHISQEELDMLELECTVDGHELLCYDKVVHCAPIPHPKQDIICLGLNYAAHAVESIRFKKETFGGECPHAVYFSKRVNEAVPDGGFIPAHADMVDSLDYEAELAIIIGKDAKNVTKAEAEDYIFGYTIMNDVSARNVQTQHKQWYFGKSLDGFTPMGPFIRTRIKGETMPVFSVKSRVNGELRQNSSTDLLIFDIPHVIEELSRGMLLQAGTIISMGTPAGVGMGFVPPKFLRPGDVVECGIQGIGTITNTVK